MYQYQYARSYKFFFGVTCSAVFLGAAYSFRKSVYDPLVSVYIPSLTVIDIVSFGTWMTS
jgi:hypothetical protein